MTDDLLRRLRLEWHADGQWPAIDAMEEAADEIERLQDDRDHWREAYRTATEAGKMVVEQRDDLRARLAECETALREIREEWAGAEIGEPQHAPEAYAIDLARRMYTLAVAALHEKAP